MARCPRLSHLLLLFFFFLEDVYSYRMKIYDHLMDTWGYYCHVFRKIIVQFQWIIAVFFFSAYSCLTCFHLGLAVLFPLSLEGSQVWVFCPDLGLSRIGGVTQLLHLCFSWKQTAVWTTELATSSSAFSPAPYSRQLWCNPKMMQIILIPTHCTSIIPPRSAFLWYEPPPHH